MGSIKIAVSGAHSTGKTTYLKNLIRLLNSEKINFKIVSDLATICPLPILHNHTIESTLWIASKGVLKEIEAGNETNVVLVDRPIIDCWAYFNNVCKDKYSNHNPKLRTLIGLIENWVPTYDYILQTVINENITIEDNKNRDLNPEYRSQIGEEMINATKRFGISPMTLEYENRKEKLEFVFNLIKEKLNESN